jgi:hypothetical protein
MSTEEEDRVPWYNIRWSRIGGSVLSQVGTRIVGGIISAALCLLSLAFGVPRMAIGVILVALVLAGILVAVGILHGRREVVIAVQETSETCEACQKPIRRAIALCQHCGHRLSKAER